MPDRLPLVSDQLKRQKRKEFFYAHNHIAAICDCVACADAVSTPSVVNADSTGPGKSSSSNLVIPLQLVVSGLQGPTYVVAPPGDRHRLFIVERAGRIRTVQDGVLLPTPFLDIAASVKDASFVSKACSALHFIPAMRITGTSTSVTPLKHRPMPWSLHATQGLADPQLGRPEQRLFHSNCFKRSNYSQRWATPIRS